ncbi:DUF4129 domain-containing protein [Spirosoma soli]|uniref:DUF4129 domain-containing protein n=1 Tax=Spirosoma soli TaxID=1770529 RepID=A0ABW5M3T8_9BACT
MTFDTRFNWRQLRLFGFFCLLIQLASGPCLTYAQTKPASVTARDDRSAVRIRYPMPEQLRDLQNDRDYQYGRDVPPPENPLARFFSYLYRRLMEFLASEAYQNFWQYVILAAIAGLVIYLLAKAEVLGFIFPKKAQTTGLDYEHLAENIHEIDFDTAIDEAVSQQSFRLAVRLLYLQTLKRLTDAGLIGYKPDKTNRQYVYELASLPIQPGFENLTRQFEFVWYGDFPVDDASFAHVRQQFRDFATLIGRQPKPVN